MPNRTKAGLNLADKNSYVRVEENINDNLLKIDDDVDATWGGLYGGYIQDETITKEIGKRYIDEFNKRAYICVKPSNVNTKDAYTECNVANNLDKLQNLNSLYGTFIGDLIMTEGNITITVVENNILNQSFRVKEDGVYLINASWRVSSTVWGNYGVFITKDNTSIVESAFHNAPLIDNTFESHQTLSAVMYLTKDNLVTLRRSSCIEGRVQRSFSIVRLVGSQLY